MCCRKSKESPDSGVRTRRLVGKARIRGSQGLARCASFYGVAREFADIHLFLNVSYFRKNSTQGSFYSFSEVFVRDTAPIDIFTHETINDVRLRRCSLGTRDARERQLLLLSEQLDNRDTTGSKNNQLNWSRESSLPPERVVRAPAHDV